MSFEAIFLVAFYCLFFGLIIYSIIAWKKWKEGIIDYCKKNKLIYHEKLATIPEKVKKFQFYKGWKSYELKSVITGKKKDIDIFFCANFSVVNKYATHKGTKNEQSSHAFCAISCPNYKLPQFSIKSKALKNDLFFYKGNNPFYPGATFDPLKKGITQNENTSIFEKYVIHAADDLDEKCVKEIFSDEARKYLDEIYDEIECYLESNGKYLGVYLQGVHPKHINLILEKLTMILIEMNNSMADKQ